ncbi:MAG: thioredoxin [Candidatus Marinimicrobia bacterium]|nr:thioredoxin [Candidatus Neomarinimicrobiota bacterium]|tara:strand:- start:6521 stop:6847 length:327 start_codon:yes stop_codon:yes gene_type:complete
MGQNTVEFSDGNFKEDVIDSSKPVLVDFWAEWCGPCKMLTPVIDEIADEYLNKATIGKLNVDHHPTIASEYGIRSIPCLLFFKDGKVQKQIMGSVPKNEIASELDKLL